MPVRVYEQHYAVDPRLAFVMRRKRIPLWIRKRGVGRRKQVERFVHAFAGWLTKADHPDYRIDTCIWLSQALHILGEGLKLNSLIQKSRGCPVEISIHKTVRAPLTEDALKNLCALAGWLTTIAVSMGGYPVTIFVHHTSDAWVFKPLDIDVPWHYSQWFGDVHHDRLTADLSYTTAKGNEMAPEKFYILRDDLTILRWEDSHESWCATQHRFLGTAFNTMEEAEAVQKQLESDHTTIVQF